MFSKILLFLSKKGLVLIGFYNLAFPKKVIVFNSNCAVVKPYMGYLAGNKIYCLARVMRNFTIDWKKSGRWSLLGASLKRFYSNEIPNAKVQINFLNHSFIVEANKEGFITLDAEVPINPKSEKILPISFKILNLPDEKYKNSESFFHGEILNAGEPKRIIISDIDDTIIHTNVLSKITMVYNSIMVGFENRQMISNANKFLQLLSENSEYPIFYVSNSPYNLYEYLKRFLNYNKFQKGPIFLRDFGRQNSILPENSLSHKHYVIEKLLQRFPNSQFVLLGDGAEHDPYVYSEMKQKFTDRISHIFLRKIYIKKRDKILNQWSTVNADPSIHIFDNYEEAISKLTTNF